MNTGAMCVSVDLELAWGVWDKPSGEYHRLCVQKERAIVSAMLDLFASHEIPVTWAIVGRLLDASGDLPQTTPFGRRIWFAPDLVEAIRNGSPTHDIGSHGFAHLYFRGSDRDRIREDLRFARRIHDEHRLPFTSFVFPRNQVAHLDLLVEAGIKVFRGVDTGWHTAARSRLGRLAGRAAHLADEALPIPPSVVQPISHPLGLVEIPGSMLLLGRAGVRRLVRPEVAEAKARLGIRRAARDRGIFHLWFHPSNFYWDTAVQLRVLEKILDEARAMRERGEIAIRTLASYAPRDDSRRQVPTETTPPHADGGAERSTAAGAFRVRASERSAADESAAAAP